MCALIVMQVLDTVFKWKSGSGHSMFAEEE